MSMAHGPFIGIVAALLGVTSTDAWHGCGPCRHSAIALTSILVVNLAPEILEFGCVQLARQRREQEGSLPASPVGSPPSSPDTSQRLPDVPPPAPPPHFSTG